MTLSPEELTKLVDGRIKTLARRAGKVCPTLDQACEDIWQAGFDVPHQFIGERIFLLGINKEIPMPSQKFSELVRD